MKAKNKNKQGWVGAFFSMMRGSKLLFAITLVCLLLSTGLTFITPQIIRVAVDSLIGDKPLNDIEASIVNHLGGVDFLRANFYIVGIITVSLAITQAACYFLRNYTSMQISNRVSRDIKQAMFTHVQKLPFKWHTSISTGDIIQRSTQDSDLISRYISNQLIMIFRIFIMITLSTSIMFMMDAAMASVVVVFIPITMLYSALVFPRIAKHFKAADEAEGRLTATLQENLSGMRVVRAFGRQAWERERFKNQNTEYANMWKRLGSYLGVYWASGDFIGDLQVLVILITGAYFTISGRISYGSLLTFITYNQMMVWPLRNAGRVLAETSKVKVAVQRIQDVLTATPEDTTSGIKPEIVGDIEFKNVSFAYEETKVLNNVSFTIGAGQTLGILGSTGSGKSTIGAVLNRLYNITEGEILIDGINIQEINLPHLRKSVGLILQEPFLFSKTVRENINLAANVDEMEIRRFAKIAGIDSDIASFSKGYDTITGEKGVTLSGGQKQRVAIARTLITKAPITVLDDSLSAVDTETDFQIRKALKENLSSTMILISHRISTLSYADKIIVLEDGRVSDCGTHVELIKREGLYKRIYDLQRNVEIEELVQGHVKDTGSTANSSINGTSSAADSEKEGE